MFKIYRFDEVESTNKVAATYPFNSVLTASSQTNGKGRFERKWESPVGGLWFSIVLAPTREVFEYVIISSLSVVESLPISTLIKWPNDVMFKDKKVCGILGESVSVGDSVEKIILGIGINVNNKAPSMGVSIMDVAGEVNPMEIFSRVLKNFERFCMMDFLLLIKEYKKHCMLIGKDVKVKALSKEVSGKVVNISERGELMLKTNSGIVSFNEGEVSVL